LKYFIIISLLLIGCCHNNQLKPLCRANDYQDRSVKKAMVQPSTPYPTLRVITDKGEIIAITLTQIDLDALECSISYYRSIHGYTSKDNSSSNCYESRGSY
jgi:hypothetical protein